MNHQFGIRELPLQLLKRYLSNRWQYTKLNNFQSEKNQISCGAPQGLSFDPLLFLLYINDLPFLTPQSLLTTLTLFDKSLVNFEIRVNNELKQIDTWLKNNKLSLNHSKTFYMIRNKSPYSLCNTKFRLLLN